ncbi:Uncharacterised protein [Klebsiella pneumoniae]|uniref:Uncharacterized protein n=1 Tax=Klebsiella pneumoniae TaxID=573 RepID=A0A377YPP8_KLEPN|nr:Uncharacterised protein [Klebsiella pneumoniae]
MLKKTVITSAVVSALLLSSSGIAAAAGDKSGAQTPAASRLVMSSDSYGRNYWAIQQP